MYPSIKEYKEAILFAEDNFEQIKNLRPVLDEDGNPVMSSGNFAVVFKMKDEQAGRLYAVKCFLRDQDGRTEAYRMISEELEYVSSTFLTSIKYLDKELFVDTDQSDETEFPVLLMDWVEGMTLDKYIREHIDDQYELSLLAYQFSRLAMWLMPQPFAHGDLKPDNILVKDDGTLVLVDYDGMYVPAMKGLRARELGSPDFRHPSRTETDFDEHIDDFSLASILLSLKAISLQPDLLEDYGASDRLLFSALDYRNLSKSETFNALRPLMHDAELASLYSLFILSLSQNNLSLVSFRLFNLSRPEKTQHEEKELSTVVTKEDLAIAWTDELGVKYSSDKKRLLKAPDNLTEYTINEKTITICDNAFYLCDSLVSLIIPHSVRNIGEFAFCGCENLTSILLPSKLKKITYKMLCGCESISSIKIPQSIISIEDEAFINCTSLKTIVIPKDVKKIGNEAFSWCTCLESISVEQGNKYYDSRNNCNAIIETSSNKLIVGSCSTIIPESINTIGNHAFAGSKISAIRIPNNIKEIKDGAFCGCELLTNVVIPDSIIHICDYAFSGCKSLTSITIPKSVNKIGIGVFSYNEGLKNILVDTYNKYYDSRNNCNAIIETSSNKLIAGCISTIIPNEIKSIGEDAFRGCYSMLSITLPSGIRSIENGAFFKCHNLTSITLPDTIKVIGNFVFESCDTMKSIILPNSVEKIGKGVFMFCKQLEYVSLSKNIKEVGPRAFFGCDSLKTIIFHVKDVSIGESAFYKCKDVKILIPKGLKRKYEEILPQYKDKLVEITSGNLSMEITEEDLATAWTDEYGVKYSEDRKRLLKALSHRFSKHVVSPVTNYSVLEGTEIICNGAFYYGQKIKGNNNWVFPAIDSTLKTVCIPSSVLEIGDEAFKDSKELMSIKIPSNVKIIGARAFAGCEKLTSIYVSNDAIRFRGSFVYEYGRKCNGIDSPFCSCPNLKAIFIPKGTLEKFENQLPSYKKLLVEILYNDRNWYLNDIRLFYKEEIEAIKTAIVGSSQYGPSVCFTMKSGEIKFIPLSNHSSLTVGDTLDLKTAKLIILSREGNDDICRVLE